MCLVRRIFFPFSLSLSLSLSLACVAVVMDLPRLPCGSLGFAKERLPNPKVTLEVFIDLNCPFSKRAFDRLVGEVSPHYAAAAQPIQFVYHLAPQPWHPQVPLLHLGVHPSCVPTTFPQSGLMAEAVVIAEALQGLGFRMIQEIFDNQSKFFDVEVYNKSRAQIYEELASLAANVRRPLKPSSIFHNL